MFFRHISKWSDSTHTVGPGASAAMHGMRPTWGSERGQVLMLTAVVFAIFKRMRYAFNFMRSFLPQFAVTFSGALENVA